MSGLIIHYAMVKKIPSRLNYYFGFFLILALLHNFLDIIGSYGVNNPERIPVWFNSLLNLFFFNILLLLPPTYLAFILVKTEVPRFKNKRAYAFIFSPYLMVLILLFSNPFTKLFYYFSNDGSYFRGPLYILILASGLLYIMASICYLCKWRKNIKEKDFYILLLSVFITVIAVVIQNFRPELLIIGVALAFSLFLLYNSSQNPNIMLDSATRTFNRTSFAYFMNDRFLTKKPYQYILIKIDDTHVINNLYGSIKGEKFIVSVAEYIKKNTPSKSAIFRNLYDSFLVVTELNSYDDFLRLVKKLRKELNVLWQFSGDQIQSIVSIAYTYETDSFTTINTAVEAFSHMYYDLRSKGRGTFLEYNAEMVESLGGHDQAEVVLRMALDGQRIEPYFQPIFDLKCQRFVLVEALARMFDNEGNIIMPKDFIPIAEKNGMISQISYQMMEKTFEYIKDDSFFLDNKIQKISFNLSALECKNKDIANRILRALKKHKIPPNRVALEITETAALSIEPLPFIMDKLTKAGIEFMLDDLGTGYANINALLKLPFSYVKLSRDTMLKSMENKKETFILKKILEIVNSLDLKIIAEGAETEEQISFLKAAGVHYIQGYYYSRPKSFGNFLAFIKEKSK